MICIPIVEAVIHILMTVLHVVEVCIVYSIFLPLQIDKITFRIVEFASELLVMCRERITSVHFTDVCGVYVFYLLRV